MRRLVAAIAAAASVAACGSSGHGPSARTVAASGPTVVAGAFNASAVYGRDAGGVVTVISVFRSAGGTAGETLQGSGFVISPGGQIVTNAHVVTVTGGAITRRASAVYVQFSDGNQVPARIVGADPNADVALLAIDSTGLRLTPLALGTSASLAVGAPVAALGSPFGQAGSMSVGVISATNRSIQSLNGTSAQNSFSIPGAIQTDAAINHGNSGGPLVNASGAVIGINSQIASSTGGGQGVGFAVPVDTVKRSVAQLRPTPTSECARSTSFRSLGVACASASPTGRSSRASRRVAPRPGPACAAAAPSSSSTPPSTPPAATSSPS
ncbi:MAG TPA: trypsin-like peptidase domain-containing protein [Solirubrobacteraceae bacterium]|jgi:S1-C subfamily serine protease|nr:trypsin-like peptidase domain-containing protein [Solirubrobacteraceae bacterium]